MCVYYILSWRWFTGTETCCQLCINDYVCAAFDWTNYFILFNTLSCPSALSKDTQWEYKYKMPPFSCFWGERPYRVEGPHWSGWSVGDATLRDATQGPSHMSPITDNRLTWTINLAPQLFNPGPHCDPQTKYCSVYCCHIQLKGESKGKAVPLQSWSGPEGSRKLRFHDNGTGWW
jgi:hypothetical protein